MKLKLFFITLVVLLQPSASLAITPGEKKSLIYDTVYYDKNLLGKCLADANVNLSGSDNFEKSYMFLVSKGMGNIGTAGILGNLIWESGGALDPKSIQNGRSGDKPIPNVGFGIAQWTTPSRQQNLVKYADSVGKSPGSLEVQLNFLWKEMDEYSGLKTELKKKTNIDEATKYFMDVFERPGVPHLDKRQSAAHQVYDKYAGSSGATDTSEAATTNECANASAAGEDTKFIDGFTVYNQGDPAWANKPYSSSTIGKSGCGPAAMAMIITALTGNKVTPVQTANYAAEKGMYVPGQGSKWTIGPVLAEKWGLKSKPIGADIAKITAALRSGGLVIASGQGPKPFTSGGHFIVIRAVTADGKFKVGDSAHNDTSDKTWDPEQLVASMNDGSVYAITN